MAKKKNRHGTLEVMQQQKISLIENMVKKRNQEISALEKAVEAKAIFKDGGIKLILHKVCAKLKTAFGGNA